MFSTPFMKASRHQSCGRERASCWSFVKMSNQKYCSHPFGWRDAYASIAWNASLAAYRHA